MGTPTIQNGAIFRYDGMVGSLKPWNVTVETRTVMDENNNPTSIAFLAPPQ